MTKIDNAEIVKALAYEIWEREGRPSGREHEHWAEANRIWQARQKEMPQAEARPQTRPWNARGAELSEIRAMRRALWTPEPFSRELFAQVEPRARAAQARGR